MTSGSGLDSHTFWLATHIFFFETIGKDVGSRKWIWEKYWGTLKNIHLWSIVRPKMEDDLDFLEMENDLNFLGEGKSTSMKWKTNES
jgi:hypothetical protein